MPTHTVLALKAMIDSYKLKEVFSRGMPTVTYVGREHLRLEQELRKAVAKGHTILAITGPSKCGKTVLRRKVIPDNVVAHVEGGQVSDEADFWDAIRVHLESPQSTSVSATKQASEGTGLSVGLNAHFAQANASLSESGSSTRQETRVFSGPEKGALLSQIREANDVLVVDDFHYIKKEIRANIVRSLKSAVFDGLVVVMLSVPYRAFDVLAAEIEMEGRFTHLTIPAWEARDLIKIAKRGFPHLNLAVEDSIESILAEEALGSPLLMQSLCSQVCLDLDILDTAEQTRVLEEHEIDIPKLFRAVAQDFGLPAFKKLAAGPSRSDRLMRPFTNGQSGDIYEAVLSAVAFAGAKEQTPYDDLRTALREVLQNDLPQKHEVTRSIQYMVEIAKAMQVRSAKQRDGGEVSDPEALVDVPAIDWVDDTLQINDVFLRFYLKWIERPNLINPNSI
jgi:hypothetical protein